MTVFQKVDGAWKVAIGGCVTGFTPAPGVDLRTAAMEILEADEDMKLQPVAESDGGGGSGPEIEAVMECMAYDCDLAIAINGVEMAYTGGNSHGQYLAGMREGAVPAEPNVLRVGENEIVMAYRRKSDGPPTTLEIRVAAGTCLKIIASRSEGRLSGTFEIPPATPEGLAAGEPHCTGISDAGSGPAAFETRRVSPANPALAFQIDVPSDWAQPEVPPLTFDADSGDALQPVSVFMAPYGVVVMMVAVRPAPATGTVAEVLVGMSQSQGLAVSEIIPVQQGDVSGIRATATQQSEAGEMTTRVLMFEQGGMDLRPGRHWRRRPSGIPSMRRSSTCSRRLRWKIRSRRPSCPDPPRTRAKAADSHEPPVGGAGAFLVHWVRTLADQRDQRIAPGLVDRPGDMHAVFAQEPVVVGFLRVDPAGLAQEEGLDVLVAHDLDGNAGRGAIPSRPVERTPAFRAVDHLRPCRVSRLNRIVPPAA